MKTTFSLALITALITTASSAPAALEKRSITLFPNYLIPLKQSTPFTAYPTQYTGEIYYSGNEGTGNEIRLIVGFDVPANAPGNCAIRMDIPAPVPGGYQNSVNGTGILDVHGYNGKITSGVTTWGNRPPRQPPITPLWTIVQPLTYGNAIVTGPAVPCNKGNRMDFEVSATKGIGGTYFDWYELTNPKTGITLDAW